MCAKVLISVVSGVALPPFESHSAAFFILLCLRFLLERGNNNSNILKRLI